jgi:hypothetical protein
VPNLEFLSNCFVKCGREGGIVVFVSENEIIKNLVKINLFINGKHLFQELIVCRTTLPYRISREMLSPFAGPCTKFTILEV